MSGERDALEAWRRRLSPVTVDGLRTYVLDEGMGEPVVCLHGIPTQAYLWRDVARVVSRGWRVVAPDLLGFGLADRPSSGDLSPSGQADFVARVLDDLRVDRCALVVHDYGALVGAELLARDAARVSHLVVTNTSFSPAGWNGTGLTPFSLLRVNGLGEAAFRLARPFMLKQAFKFYVEAHERLDAETMAVYWHPFTDGFGDVLLRLFRDSSARLSDDAFTRWKAALGRFERPALVVWGDKDPTFRTTQGQAITGLLPDAQIEVFEHSNHFVQEDRPEALGRLIAAFLSGRYKP